MRVIKAVVTTFFVILFFKNHFTFTLNIYFDGNSTINTLYSEADNFEYDLKNNFELILKFFNSHMNNKFVKIIGKRLEKDKLSDKIIQRLQSPRGIITTVMNLHGGAVFKNTSEYHKFYDYLFFPENLQQLISILQFAYNQEDWAPRRIFFNVVTCKWNKGSISTSIEYFRKIFAFNVVFIKVCKDTLIGYTWKPKEGKGCKFSKRVSLVQFNLNQTKSISSYGNLKTFNGCPLKIGWFYGNLKLSNETDNLGSSYSILEAIGKIVNAKIIVNDENFAYRSNFESNLSADVLIGDMEKDLVDIGVGYVLDMRPSPLIELTFTTKSRRNYWLLPQRRSILPQYLLYRDLGVMIWLFVLFIFVIIILALQNYVRTRLYEAISKWPFSVFAISFALNAGNVRNKLLSFRLILILGIIFGLHISVGFYSFTSSLMTNPPLEPKITKFRDLAKSRFKLRTFKSIVIKTASKYDKNLEKMILSKWIPTKYDVILNETRDFVNSVDYAILTGEKVRMIIRNYKEVDKVSDAPYNGFLEVFVVRNGFPLLDRINEILSRIFQAGLVYKWAKIEMSLYPKVEVPTESHHVAVPLTLQKISTAFLVLGVGLCLSTIIFILEIILHNKNQISTKTPSGSGN